MYYGFQFDAADQASSSVIVSNSTFLDISGGGIKLGSSGERGAKSPNVTLEPSMQDRGFLVSDNLMVRFNYLPPVELPTLKYFNCLPPVALLDGLSNRVLGRKPSLRWLCC